MDRLKIDFKVYSFQMDFRGNAKVTSICDYLQEAAGAHAIELGFSPRDLLIKGMYWVLYRLSIHMKKYPKGEDTISIVTWVSSMKGPFSDREFEIYNSDNELIGEASTLWFAVNSKTRKPQTIGDIGKSGNMAMGLKKMKRKPEKLKKISDAKLVNKFYPDYTHLDINYHINNVKYIEIITSVIPLSKFEGAEICSLDINYLGEPSNDIQLIINYCKIDSDSDYYELTNQANKDIALVKLQWRNID